MSWQHKGPINFPLRELFSDPSVNNKREFYSSPMENRGKALPKNHSGTQTRSSTQSSTWSYHCCIPYTLQHYSSSLQVQPHKSTLGSHLPPPFHTLLKIVYIASIATFIWKYELIFIAVNLGFNCICIGKSRDPLQGACRYKFQAEIIYLYIWMCCFI